jgi:hypothetical protein
MSYCVIYQISSQSNGSICSIVLCNMSNGSICSKLYFLKKIVATGVDNLYVVMVVGDVIMPVTTIIL